MKVRNKSAKEILIEVKKLEDRRDKEPKACDCSCETEEAEAYELMKSFIENIHPGLVAF